MAAAKYQASSSSRFSHCKYRVFLSFRGEDTRKNFTDHLYTALVQAGIHTFRDDDEIGRGENIESELQKAIQQSKIAIIVFSKDYASSRWCLDEIVMIMERRRTADCRVLPVFYDVDPSQVRKQTGSFAAAFVEHEKHFKEEMERVNGWRIALKEVADLAGMVLGDGYEALLVQCIVAKVSKNLDRKIFHVPLHFIGRDPLVNYINSWLQDESHDVATAMLYGIGGVGKTAIAKSVFNQNFRKFECRSYLSNVREISKESKGVVCLQRQLLSDILNQTVDEIHDVDEGILKIKDALCCRRTLIVLDDVDNRDQFNAIIGMQEWLCQGCKIIVTTRNKGLIAAQDEFVKCKVEPLDNKKSLELFSWHAFGQAYPVEGFVEDSWRIVHHCNGLPLALRVIGSSLSGKGRKLWGSALQELAVIPNCEVQNVLEISYHSLDDDYQKNIFLDIACFFNGMDVDYAVTILDGLGIGARFRIDKLIDRCLVEINNDKRLWMHQLVRDMGREIARQESPKCQRTWHHEDAFRVLNGTTDAEKLCGLTIDMHALMEDDYAEVACTSSMFLPKLKILDLRHSHDLIRTPDFSGLLGLEKLILEDCIRLVQIHESIGDLQRLLILNLRNCISLMELPEEMCRLNSLQELVLDCCSNLDRLMNMVLEHHQERSLLQSDGIVASTSYITSLPLKLLFPSRFSARKMLRFTSFSLPRSLERLDLSGTPIRFLPESIKDLGLLRGIYLRNCKMLEALPELPSHLILLDVSFCNSLQRLANLVANTKADGCDQLVEFQDRMKQELIQKFDSHMFRIMETIAFIDGTFSVVIYVFDEDEKSRWFYEDKWLIQNEFVDNFSFKISSPPPAHRICGFTLFTRFCMTSEYTLLDPFYIIIRNNTSGRYLRCQAYLLPVSYKHGVREFQSFMHRKLGGDDPTFDNGDEVSISVRRKKPAIQIRTIGVQWLHEEEGKDDDIQSKDEVINAHNSSDDAAHLLEIWGHSIMVMDSVFPDGPVVQIKRVGVRMLHEEEGTDDNSSSSNSEVNTAYNSSDDVPVAKAEIASLNL
ncbi:disease resistance protein RUN1 [Populus trichocarpa]|nr:disease resistance protein RUN1 [Populus trichocarpa]